ncbi:hypothetical protein ACWELQ_44095, partial [Nocardia sp. NPDC004722]
LEFGKPREPQGGNVIRDPRLDFALSGEPESAQQRGAQPGGREVWEPVGAPEPHVPPDARVEARIEELTDRARQARERAADSRSRLDELARGLGIPDPESLSGRALERAVGDAFDAARHGDEPSAATPADREFRTYFDENLEAARLTQQAHALAIEDVLRSEADHPLESGLGLKGEPPSVLVVTDHADPSHALSAELRASLAEQGVPVEYRRVQVADDGSISVQTIRPASDSGHPAAPERPTPEGPAQRRGLPEHVSLTDPAGPAADQSAVHRDPGSGGENGHTATDSNDWSPRPDDVWSGLDHERIADRLRDEFGVDITSYDEHLETDVPGFAEHFDVEVVREYARAIEDMFRDHPGTGVREVHIGPLGEHVFAETTPGRGEDGRLRADRITLSDRYAREPEALARDVARAEEAGLLTRGSAQRPVYSTIVHEFAHALDLSGGLHAGDRAFDAMLRHYAETRGNLDGFESWFADQRGLAFDKHGRWDPSEALAEAFTDDVLNGAGASEQSKVLSQVLIDAHEARAAHPGDESRPAEPAQRHGLPDDEHGLPDGEQGGPRQESSREWLDRQRAIQADWEVRMEQQRAAFLREAAEFYAPGTMDRFRADFEADHADWRVRMATHRAEFLWDIAGGRPEAPTPEPTHDPNASTVETTANDPNAATTPLQVHDPNAATVPTPVHDPNAATVQTPAHDPNAATVQTPVHDPNAATVHTPVHDPNAATVQTPVHDPNAATVQTPVHDPNAATVEVAQSGAVVHD